MEHWKTIFLHHEDLDMHVMRLENGEGESLVAAVKLYTTISEATILYTFLRT